MHNEEPIIPEPEKHRFLPGKRRLFVIGAILLACLAGGTGFWLWWQSRDTKGDNTSKSEPSIYESIAHTGDVDFSASIDVTQKIDYYISEAWILQNANRPEEALDMLREGEKLAEDGPYPQLYAAFGDIYALQKNKTEARKYYNKALDVLDASALSDKDAHRELYQEQIKNL